MSLELGFLIDLENIENLSTVEDSADSEAVSVPRRVVRDQANPLEFFNDREFKSHHGFSKEGFLHVLRLFGPKLTKRKKKDAPVPALLVLSTFLNFLRSNSFLRCVSTHFTIQLSVATVGRIVNDTAKIIANEMNNHVKFPDQEEQKLIASRFFEDCGIPGIIGVIDGSLIKISKPKFVDKVLVNKFYSRKGYFAWNSCAVVDDNLKFRWAVCKNPGSAHDSRIYNESHLKALLESQFNPKYPMFIIGDEGFQNQKTLLVPIRDDRVETDAQKKFNDALKKVRVKVEHAFGVWKKRFPAMLYGLRKDKQETSQATIFASFVLHNLALDMNEPAELPKHDKKLVERFEQMMRESQNDHVPAMTDGNKFVRDLIIARQFQ